MNIKHLWIVLGLAAVGCSQEPATHPVSGTVTFGDGSAANVGLIEFLPVAGGPSPRGLISPGGAYTLTTFESDDGAPVGDYVVLVSQPQLAVGLLRPAPEGHNDEHHAGQSPDAGLAPPLYGRRASSPLRATIREGDNQLDFVLETSNSGESVAPTE